MTRQMTLDDAAEAIEEVVYRFQSYTAPHNDLTNAAHHLVGLSNAVGDLASYHPDYDERTGTLPFEREED